jgi:hypothetical protein
MNFSQANLGLVAYADVVGATGLSPELNSGVVTARTSIGSYTITLPGGQFQSSDRDMMFVQVKGATPLFHCTNVSDTNPSVKQVFISSSSTTAVDADFSVLIFRSLLNPPAGSPA